MMKKIYKFVVLLLLCQTYVFAQNISVTGKVTDSDNLPLPGVSVKVSGSAQGTSTDTNGNFTISVPGTGTLVFTSIGFTTQTVPVQGRTTLNIRMANDAQQLEGVVVTALGIERSSKSLTYNTTNISAEELNAVKGANVLNALAGKAAGVFVTQGNGGPGSSPRIIIRGNKSIAQGNQPLYVVDGIPMGFSDFNQEDVESLQVLQGPSASALYGSNAANGVIMITTKKGKLGAVNVDFASTAMYDKPLLLPDVQTDFGPGLNGAVVSSKINDSWGPKITNGSDSHIADFFRTGENYINSLSVSSGTAAQRIYFSYANTQNKALIPGYDYTRHNVTLRGNTRLFKDKVELNGGINYINNYTKNVNGNGWTDSPMFGLYLFPTGDNMDNYSANKGTVWNATRGLWAQNWPYIKNEHSSNQNPYWLVNWRQNNSYNNRTVMNVGAKWNINNWLNFSARETYTLRDNNGESRVYATAEPINYGPNGAYSRGFGGGSDFYTELLLNANKSFGSNITLNASAGFINQQGRNQSISVSNAGSGNTLAYPNAFSVQGLNGTTGQFNSSEALTKYLEQAVLGTASIGWKETLFLDVTGRNEWSYTVDKPFFYPSVGLGYILTETIGSNDILSFAKIRGTYAEVGNSLPRGANNRNPYYSIANNENINGRGSLPFFSGTDTSLLSPERTKSWEIGTDLRFFKDKLNLSVTYYNGTTDDQVISITAPSGAGASNFWINGGSVQNRGIEAGLSYNANFGAVNWTPSFNFSKNVNEIKSLSPLLSADRFVLAGGNRLVHSWLLRPGSTLAAGRTPSFMDLFGKTYVRDANGNITYNAATGLPIISPVDNQFVGNANPDFLLNMNNQFSYKKFTLSFLVDGRFGGLTSSSTEQWLDYKGLSQRSGDARNSADGLMDIGGPKRVSPELYYSFISAKADGGALADTYLFDTTNIRMRELALGFTLPKFTNAVRNMSLTLVGRNLFFFHREAPFDPELANGTGDGGQGFESFQMPSARSIGLTLRAGL
ncbi:MAG: SusC/RagA family TonB-linked outer membrane protein [Bacteroidota bacterium]